MKKRSIISLAALLAVSMSGNALDAISLNEHGWLFPLSRYQDWKGKTATQEKNPDGLAAISCRASAESVNIRSAKLVQDLAQQHLPEWEYAEMTIPAAVAPGVRTTTLQMVSMRKGTPVRVPFPLRPDGALKTYLTKPRIARDKTKGFLKLSELSNLYFTLRTPENTVFKFGDLQVYLRGKTKLISVPVADAAAVDSVPGEADWKNAPSFGKFQNSLREPDGKELKAPTTVRFLHDAKCLYVRFDQKTDTSKLISKQNRDGQIWRDDSFQLLISPGNDNRSYHQFIVNPAGAGQSYHHVFDQVADGYIRATNRRPGEWKVTVNKKPDSWNAVFAIQKTLLDKYAGESIHGIQILVDNSASGGGLGSLLGGILGVVRVLADSGVCFFVLFFGHGSGLHSLCARSIPKKGPCGNRPAVSARRPTGTPTRRPPRGPSGPRGTMPACARATCRGRPRC